jgi:hypothetical protein
MSEAALRTARLAAAGLLVAVALASTVKTYPESWRFLHREQAQFSGYTAQDRLEVAAYANAIPIDAYNFFRAHLTRKERYFLAVPPGASPTGGVSRPAALQAFARYYLLPAIAVATVDEADAIVSVGTDPATLGYPLGEVVRDGSNPFWFARLAR